MTDDHVKGLERALGNLEGTVKSLVERWGEQDRLAGNQRRGVYERLELLTRQIDAVANDVQNVQQDVAEMRNEIEDKVMPVVEAHELNEATKGEEKRVLSNIWWGITVLAVVLGYVIDRVLQIKGYH
jgi:hypothetical protein